MRDYVRIAKAYARDIRSGKIPACDQIKQACARFEADLKSKVWKLDKAKAERACQIIELLPHTKGDLASRGELMRLEPWQCFIIVSLLGFVGLDGLRKYREAFLLIPRKNGKSQLAACIALVLAFADDEIGAEVWLGANSKDQAKAVFTPAKLMSSIPMFVDAFGVEVRASSIMNDATGSFVQPMIGKPKDGTNPHCAILDEAHEADDSTAYDAMKTGMGARSQPLLITITTAGMNLAGPCYAQQRYAETVLRGDAKNERLFAAIYTIDDTDSWRDFDCWRKANPNLGVSIFEDSLKAAYTEALQRPEKAAIAKTKHLNQWVSSKSAWLNQHDWANAADETLDINDYAGCTASLGLDLATVNDFSGVVARVDLPDGRQAYFPYLFLPERAIERSKSAEAYRGWQESGEALITDGAQTDFSHIEDKIRELCNHLNVTAIGYDAWQGEAVAQRLRTEGYEAVKCSMNVKTFTQPMDELEAELTIGKIVHPNNRAFNWMAGNVVAKRDRFEGIMPDKPPGQDHLKIDGMVAALMAKAVSATLEKPLQDMDLVWLD